MARIDDVARLAGVSTATVSRALRGLPTVSADTRGRVLAAASQLGYTASPFASRLAGGRSGAVAVVVPRVTRWLFAAVVQAAGTALHEAGHDLLLYTTRDAGPADHRPLPVTGPHRLVDGVLLVAAPPSDDVVAAAGSGLPGVTVGSGPAMPGWPVVGVDEAAAVRTATEHLLSLGHRRIGYLAGPAGDRRRGFLAALSAAGPGADPELMVGGEDTLDGGADAAARLLRRRPTALVAECDEMAMGAMLVLRRAGLRVPEDVSVVGIDGHELGPAVGLSTVAQPAAEQGRRAAAALLAPLRGHFVEAAAAVILPTHLVVRASTGPVPGTIER